MLAPLSLSPVVKSPQTSAAGIVSSSTRCGTELLQRSGECKRFVYCCSSSSSSSQKDAFPPGKNGWKFSRLKGVPLCSAQFKDLNSSSSFSSPTIEEITNGSTSLYNTGSGSHFHPPPAPTASLETPHSLADGRYNNNHRAFDQVNTVGILGGLNPLATVEFMRKIVDASNVENDGELIPVLLCSDPNMRKSVLSRRMPAKSIFNPALPEESWAGAEEIELLTVDPLIQKRRFLEASGAKCIVMPCHISHLWFDQIVEGCTVPFLEMADCVIDELKAADLQPLEAGIRPKIGVLGSEATLTSDFYQEKLRSQGFDVALPDKATMEHAVIPGLAALQRRDMEGARNLLRIAIQVLLVNAVNIVVLACHNMPTAFDPSDPILRKCIDPSDALARAAVRWSKTTRGVTR
ncbi:hypothetical protein R1sor_010829 [Riccia sorocarpa]|uniref:Aspartate racemase n=1 Tax=Riccia sorocarpa TaxID=122646 RepID=A0ABD3HZ78_9MARC